MRLPAPPQPFLSRLGADDVAELRTLAFVRRYPPHTVVFHEGDEAGAVLVIHEGRAKIYKTSTDAREMILAFVGPGDLVGEISAIDGGSRSGSVAAVDPLVVLAVARADFMRFAASRPTVATVLLTSLAARLRDADAQRLDFARHDATSRVARRLLELGASHGSAGPGGLEITLPISQEELAAWTDCSREAVAKALAVFRHLGWVETRRRHIVIADLSSLRAFAS